MSAVTTTATYGYDPELAEILEEAFERAGIAPAVIGTEHINSALRSLRLMLGSEWQTRGLRNHMMGQATQATTAGMASFTLPANSIDIIDMVVRQDGRDTGLYRIARQDYLMVANKESRGRPANYFVDRQADVRTVYLWPCSAGPEYSLVYNYFRKNMDPGSLANTTAIGAHLIEAMTAGLAARLSGKFNLERFSMLIGIYEGLLKMAITEDRDRAPLQLTVRT